MNCPSCGKELFDNGEARFSCPFCGAEIAAVKTSQAETVDERLARLEKENERLRMICKIESQGESDHFWNTDSIFSMSYRQSAREALARGDLEAAGRALGKAEKASNIGCLLQMIALVIFIIVLCCAA